jgi:hypothetical protein
MGTQILRQGIPHEVHPRCIGRWASSNVTARFMKLRMRLTSGRSSKTPKITVIQIK